MCQSSRSLCGGMPSYHTMPKSIARAPMSYPTGKPGLHRGGRRGVRRLVVRPLATKVLTTLHLLPKALLQPCSAGKCL